MLFAHNSILTQYLPDVHAITAILKVQRGQEADLRPVEAATLANCVLKEQVDSDTTPTPPASAKRLKDVLASRKAARNSGVDSKYGPAVKHAILGSAA